MDDLGVAVTLLVSSGVTRAAPSRVESLTPPQRSRRSGRRSDCHGGRRPIGRPDSRSVGLWSTLWVYLSHLLLVFGQYRSAATLGLRVLCGPYCISLLTGIFLRRVAFIIGTCRSLIKLMLQFASVCNTSEPCGLLVWSLGNLSRGGHGKGVILAKLEFTLLWSSTPFGEAMIGM